MWFGMYIWYWELRFELFFFIVGTHAVHRVQSGIQHVVQTQTHRPDTDTYSRTVYTFAKARRMVPSGLKQEDARGKGPAAYLTRSGCPGKLFITGQHLLMLKHLLSLKRILTLKYILKIKHPLTLNWLLMLKHLLTIKHIPMHPNAQTLRVWWLNTDGFELLWDSIYEVKKSLAALLLCYCFHVTLLYFLLLWACSLYRSVGGLLFCGTSSLSKKWQFRWCCSVQLDNLPLLRPCSVSIAGCVWHKGRGTTFQVLQQKLARRV